MRSEPLQDGRLWTLLVAEGADVDWRNSSHYRSRMDHRQIRYKTSVKPFTILAKQVTKLTARKFWNSHFSTFPNLENPENKVEEKH